MIWGEPWSWLLWKVLMNLAHRSLISQTSDFFLLPNVLTIHLSFGPISTFDIKEGLRFHSILQTKKVDWPAKNRQEKLNPRNGTSTRKISRENATAITRGEAARKIWRNPERFFTQTTFSVQWGGAGATSHGENQWLLSSLLHSGRNSRQDFHKKIFANWRWLGLNSLNEINHYIQTRLYEKQEAIQSMLKCLTGLEVGFQA